METRSILLAIAVLCCSTLLPALTIVAVPHPDDETLGIAGKIRERVLAGDEVWVVMATHGEASGVKSRLNGTSYCSQCGRTHNPVDEGFLPEDLVGGLVSTTGFGNARLREFAAAMDVLGVPPDKRRILDYGDGQVTPEKAAALFAVLAAEFGADADYITVQGSNDTTHVDHTNMANALAANTAIPAARKSFYAVYEYGQSTHPGQPTPVSIQPYMQAKRDALDCYKLWAPAGGRYRIGYHSVATLITNAGALEYEFPQTLTSGIEAWPLYD